MSLFARGRPGFYHPRTLGRPRPRAAKDRDRPEPARLDHEAWREGVRRVEIEYERLPEARVRDELLREATSPAGCALVTGEPGAGKSTLLDAWLAAWAQAPPAPRLGALVPVLVRLRDLPREDASALCAMEPACLADRLWQLRLPAPAAIRDAVAPFHDRADGRLWRPLWLLDGLDELPATLLGEPFLRRLAHLPGRVCLTCRTAIAQSLGAALAACTAPGAAYELLPLSDPERLDYLTRCFAGDAGRAGRLHGRVQGNAQLREIAGNPLLLDLIAEVGEETELPASRAEFYGRAVGALWKRRLTSSEANRLRKHRDPVLTDLAAGVELREVVFAIEHLDRALEPVPENERETLREALRTSGLLRLDEERERAEFLHLTFQEHYLARHLGQRPLGETLRRRWSNPRDEETLALLLAQAIGEGRTVEADTALHGLIAYGQETHRRDPATLWRLGRSPLRTALHIVHRAGVELERLERTTAVLAGMLDRSLLLRMAVASDRRSPASLLARLAADENKDVRRMVARNTAASSEVLARVSLDGNADVRRGVAENRSAPISLLVQLVTDKASTVRRGLVLNWSTPPEALSCLARDEDKFVRENAALMERVYSLRVRLQAGLNTDVPPVASEDLTAPLDDPTDDVTTRLIAASNPSAPSGLLNCLVEDQNIMVRCTVAENPSAPPGLLARLAQDNEAVLRRGVAENPAAPADLLARLAEDEDWGVRMGAARNPSTLPEDLAAIV